VTIAAPAGERRAGEHHDVLDRFAIAILRSRGSRRTVHRAAPRLQSASPLPAPHERFQR
jgi:hypothetical protein